jgi:hypothetical protein
MELSIHEILKNQMLAALATLKQGIDNCPDHQWNESHNDAPFSQAAFHGLFFLDYYLSEGEEDFKSQAFHREHTCLFRDYEELLDKKPEHLYSKAEITGYLGFCRQKIDDYFREKSRRDWLETSGHRNMSLLELAVYNTRHIQHHAAQLGLRLQQVSGRELQWVGSGWR